VPSKAPEAAADEQFDESDFLELEVDGRSIARLRVIDDAMLSDIDDAMLGVWLQVIGEEVGDQIEQEYDVEPEELIERHGPEVRAYDSDEAEWEVLSQ
jgi:hypothetical protein